MMFPTSSLKIIQLNSMKIWAGGEVHVVLLCNDLRALGETVTLSCRPGTPIDQKAREATIPVLNLPLSGSLDLKSAWQLAKYCRENSIDIIHAHTGRDYWLATWTKLFYPKLKLVITRHIRCPLRNSAIHQWAYQKVDKLIAVSQAVRSCITNLPSSKIAVIYNGIDLERFSTARPGILRKELNISPETKIIGMVGRVNPVKGHETLIESIPEIRAKFPDTVFVVIGGGDYIATLQTISKDVVFLGMRSNVPELMKDLDVFVLASWDEPFGLVTVEAMAAGIPIVATNTGGTLEIITNEETGLLVSPKDAKQLAQSVIRILTDRNLADKLRTNEVIHSKNFSIKEMAIQIRKLYYEVLGKD